ncbi:low affinity iron permease family protein [Ferruginibacter albus]|uniref:low affinity iron permease family protein n=1 Tax=Ferruginibacter albus TaxID=2875540 RepID=UPI001CC3AF36|nr:low affinity iron permease family protein [Ferruginibacter albus]UAY53346.1 low affinity iron permease family protein [Ferruginibacter albus]
MKKKKDKHFFTKFSAAVTKATGSPIVFLIAFLIIVVWCITGPFFHFSDTWQLIINTSTTIITFLMVFVIQQSQNRDTLALQLKLNELIAANKDTSNRLIDIEDLSDQELAVLKKFYVKLAKLAAKDNDLFSTHSIDEATEKHNVKHDLANDSKKQSLKNKTHEKE